MNIDSEKAIINLQNNDEKFFNWVNIVKHVTGDHKIRFGINYTIHEDIYDFRGLTFHTPLSEIKIFEKNNLNQCKLMLIICINVNVNSLKKKFFLKIPHVQ